MAINYIAANGQDLDDVFDFYVTGTSPAATGFLLSSGVDLNTRYAPIVFGSAASATGHLISNGNDLNTLFAAKGTASYIIGSWINSDNFVDVTSTSDVGVCRAEILFRFFPAGNFVLQPTGGGTSGQVFSSPLLSGDWVLNTYPTIGNEYEIRVTLADVIPQVGTVLTQNQMSSWVSLSTQRAVTLLAEVPAGINQVRRRKVSATVEFRKAGTTTVISSETLTMDVFATRDF